MSEDWWLYGVASIEFRSYAELNEFCNEQLRLGRRIRVRLGSHYDTLNDVRIIINPELQEASPKINASPMPSSASSAPLR